jgi:hypothetical protein
MAEARKVNNCKSRYDVDISFSYNTPAFCTRRIWNRGLSSNFPIPHLKFLNLQVKRHISAYKVLFF